MSSSRNTVDERESISENQIVSVFGRWVLSRSNVELFWEFAREDFSDSLTDFLGEPDHASAWSLGLQKAWEVEGAGVSLFRVEMLDALPGPTSVLRGNAPFYRHTTVPQGHTHRGQTLGTPSAHGGAGLTLSFLQYRPWGRWSTGWVREARDEGLSACTGCRLPSPGVGPDVLNSFFGDAVFFIDRWELKSGLAATLNLNRNFVSDVWNVRFSAEARAVF